MIATDVKMALVNYNELKKAIQEELDQLDEINAQRFKVGGSIIRIPENAKPRDIIIIENLAKLDTNQRNLSMHMYLIALADNFMNCLPKQYREMVEDKYIKKLCEYDLEDKHGYTRMQIHNIINKLIDKYIEIT